LSKRSVNLVLISESQDQVSKQHLLLSKFGLQCGRQTPTTVLLYADICNHLTAVKITRTRARTHAHTRTLILCYRWQLGTMLIATYSSQEIYRLLWRVVNCFGIKGKGAPLCSESPPQKCSGMVRVLKGFHSFTCTPTRSLTIGMSHTCLCLPSYSRYSFTDPGGMEGWVDLGVNRPRFEPATSRL